MFRDKLNNKINRIKFDIIDSIGNFIIKSNNGLTEIIKRDIEIRKDELLDEIKKAESQIENLRCESYDQRSYEELKEHEAELQKNIDDRKHEYALLLKQYCSLQDRFCDLERQLKQKEDYLNKILEINKEKDKSIWEIAGALSAVTEGVFREDCVEFAALKTYRGGWEYIYLNGNQVENYKMAHDFWLRWIDGSPVKLEMNIESRKK